MALPIEFPEQNGVFTPGGYDLPYPIYTEKTMLGNEETIDVYSVWSLSERELFSLNESEGFVFVRVIGGQPPICVVGASPVPFEGQNCVYTHSDCLDLPVHRRNVVRDGRETIEVVSAWQLDRENLAHANMVRYVVLRVVGGQPIVNVTSINPID